MYEFHLPSKVPVEKVFSYLPEKLGGQCTMYGGSAFGETMEGNTFLTILRKEYSDDPLFRRLERLYYVNPYAGAFGTVSYETTDHVAIIPVSGKALSDELLSEIRQGLEGLREPIPPVF